jgi:hypothetical protein
MNENTIKYRETSTRVVINSFIRDRTGTDVIIIDRPHGMIVILFSQFEVEVIQHGMDDL